jgi:hypothetical protein
LSSPSPAPNSGRNGPSAGENEDRHEGNHHQEGGAARGCSVVFVRAFSTLSSSPDS